MEKNLNWKRIVLGVILIFIIVWLGTSLLIGNIMNLSVGIIATVIAFASIITYLFSKFL